MKNVLWISPYAPYDKVSHAGGKTHNYYVKYLHQSNEFRIHLISLCLKKEKPLFDLDQYGISNQIKAVDENIFQTILRIFYNVPSVYYAKHKLCHTILSYQYHCLKKMLLKQRKQTTPDIVIMQWTGAAFLLPEVKKWFPDSCVVVIEEDVAFLGHYRRYKKEQNPRVKRHKKQLYEQLKKTELALLKQSDVIVVNNEKDRDLLVNNAIAESKKQVLAPYYENYSKVDRSKTGKDIIYFGAMEREENHQAAMWLIKEVLPLITDEEVRIVVIGSNPLEELKKQESTRVVVKGYVEDVSSYLANGLCMAVPLQLGAGIKVKVLEGLSAGIPMLTNDIGMEGIPAKKEEEYYYCQTPLEYASVIEMLLHSKEERERICMAEKRFMQETYNIDRRLDEFIKRLLKES